MVSYIKRSEIKSRRSQSKRRRPGYCRIDPEAMEKLGIADTGEVISIKAKRQTVAKVMPTFPEFRGGSIVKLMGIIRKMPK